jgi:site-specific DNA-methyltransferase (adenine-specific)
VTRFEVRTGDCLAVMRTLDDSSVDSIVTDPPYELGFMGKSWDASGVAFRVEVWREVLRVLKPDLSPHGRRHRGRRV